MIPDWASLRNILVARPDNIGDVVMTSPALRALRAAAPQARLTLLASPSGAQVGPLLPWVDEVLARRVLWQDLGRLDFDPQREWDLIEDLRGRHFDAAVLLTSFSQSPHAPALACALAGIPHRIGASKERGTCLTLEVPGPPDELHQTERNLRLLERAGVRIADRSLCLSVPAAATQRVRERLAERGVTGAYLLFNPWTTSAARTYPPEHFARAARIMAERSQLPVVVTGAPAHRDDAAPLLGELREHGVNLVGATDLTEFAALIQQATLVLTNNTSALHIADAFRTPILCTYSGTELESQWGPRRSRHTLLRRETACSPCHAFSCPYDLECLAFSPEEVARAGLELLEGSSAGRTARPAGVSV